MIAALLNPRAWLAMVLVFVLGGWAGVQWQRGTQARADAASAEARAADSRRQIRIMDTAAGQHAAALKSLNTQLGAARVQIQTLSGRECLDGATVGLLNDIGDPPLRAPAGDPDRAPPAAAAGGGLRYTSDIDAAHAIGTCRAGYAALSSQLNQILDIEQARQSD